MSAPFEYILHAAPRTAPPLEGLFDPKQKETFLHYIIETNQCTVQQLEKYLQAHPDAKNSKDPRKGLTPLAVAVIKGNEGLVKAFLLNPYVDPIPTDKMGWTPFHYTLLSGDTAIEHHLAVAAMTSRAAIPNLPVIKKMLHPLLPSPEKSVFLMEKQNCEFVFLTAREFANTFHANFCLEPRATIPNLIKYWTLGPHIDDTPPEKRAYYIDQISQYRNKPPLLYCTEKEGGQIVAKEDIAAGQVIGFHGGDLIPLTAKELQDWPSATDYFYPFDPSRLTNPATLIQHGFPNCCRKTVFIDGVPSSFYIAFCNIAKGEILKIDEENANSLRKTRFSPLSEQLISFFQIMPLEIFYEKLVTLSSYPFSSQREELCGEGFQKRFRYLATPFVLIQLILQEIIQPQEVLALFNKENFFEVIQENPSCKKILISIAQNLLSIQAALKNHHLSAEVLANIALFLQKYDIIRVTSFLAGLAYRLSLIKNQNFSQKDVAEWFDSFHQNAKAEKTLIEWMCKKVSLREAELAVQRIDPQDWKFIIYGELFAQSPDFCQMAATACFKKWLRGEKKHNFDNALLTLRAHLKVFQEFIAKKEKFFFLEEFEELDSLFSTANEKPQEEKSPHQGPFFLLPIDPAKLEDIRTATHQAKAATIVSEIHAYLGAQNRKKTDRQNLIAILHQLSREEREQLYREIRQTLEEQQQQLKQGGETGWRESWDQLLTAVEMEFQKLLVKRSLLSPLEDDEKS